MNYNLKSVLQSPAFNLSAAMIIVGSSVICGKVLTQEIPLFLASEIRFLLSTLLFIPFGIYNKKLLFIPRHDLLILSAMSFCGQVVFTILLLWGLRYTSGINAGTLTSTTPFFMAIIAILLLNEKYGKVQIIALCMSLSSIMCLSYDSFIDIANSNFDQTIGNLMVLGAVMGESCFLLLGKKLKTNISGINQTAILSLLGVIICLPPAIAESIHFPFHSLTYTDLLAMLYLGWIYTNLAYFCWFNGLKRTSGANAGIYTALMPISASFFSLLLMNESINLYQGLALFLAISSIIISTSWKRVADYGKFKKRNNQIQPS